MEGDNLTKTWLLVQFIMKLWGTEIFEWLEKEADKTDTALDNVIVEGLRRWLLPS